MIARLRLGVRGLSCSSLMRHFDEAPQDAEGTEEPLRFGRQRVPARPATPAYGGARGERAYEPNPWAS
jgi:hypothetical protein